MMRTALIEMILKSKNVKASDLLVEALKRLSDCNLIALAIDMGLDVQKVLAARS